MADEEDEGKMVDDDDDGYSDVSSLFKHHKSVSPLQRSIQMQKLKLRKVSPPREPRLPSADVIAHEKMMKKFDEFSRLLDDSASSTTSKLTALESKLDSGLAKAQAHLDEYGAHIDAAKAHLAAAAAANPDAVAAVAPTAAAVAAEAASPAAEAAAVVAMVDVAPPQPPPAKAANPRRVAFEEWKAETLHILRTKGLKQKQVMDRIRILFEQPGFNWRLNDYLNKARQHKSEWGLINQIISGEKNEVLKSIDQGLHEMWMPSNRDKPALINEWIKQLSKAKSFQDAWTIWRQLIPHQTVTQRFKVSGFGTFREAIPDRYFSPHFA